MQVDLSSVHDVEADDGSVAVSDRQQHPVQTDITASSSSASAAAIQQPLDSAAEQFAELALEDCTQAPTSGTPSDVPAAEDLRISGDSPATSVTPLCAVPIQASNSASAATYTDSPAGCLATTVNHDEPTDVGKPTSSRRRRNRTKSSKKNESTPLSGKAADHSNVFSVSYQTQSLN